MRVRRGHQCLQRVGLHLDGLVKVQAVSNEVGGTPVVGEVPGTSWEDAGLHHLDHGCGLNLKGGDVALVHDLGAGPRLVGGEHLHGLESVLVLRGAEGLDGLGGRVKVRQPTARRFPGPVSRVAVAGEDNLLVLLEHGRHGLAVVLPVLDALGQVGHASRHHRVADRDGEGAVLRGAHGPELEAVAAEGEGGRAVPVLDVCLHVHRGPAAGALLLPVGLVRAQLAPLQNVVDVLLKANPREERDDRGRRLLGAKAVVVACMCHGAPHQLIVLAEAVRQARNGRDKERLRVLGLARVKEVEARVRADGPVGVLAAAVDAGEGLLVEEGLQSELAGLLGQDLHEEHVRVGRDVGSGEDGRHLVLTRRDLVVADLHGAAHAEHLR
mmetsp:Transcript_21214/g.48457  ORF Transcript_21214/g.48457 Transcript_21214/m.48457 type:complete len:382 (+) Transcript_21214:280-1425(+)